MKLIINQYCSTKMDKSRSFPGKSSFLRGMLFAAMMFSVGAVSAQGPEIKQARRFVELDQVNKAISALTDAVAKYPQDPSVVYQLGLAQLQANQLDQALATFEKGIPLDEKDGQNLAGKGHVLLLKNNASEAQALFTKALALSKSKDPKTLKAVAEAKLEKGANADEALMLAKKAASIETKDEHAYILMGDAYLAKNNGGLAVSEYEHAASANPKSGFPHYKIGMVYLRSKNAEAAEAAFKKAIEIDPDYTLAYKEMGESYYLNKKYAEAVKAYENYLRLSENPKDGKLRLAFFYFSAGEYEKANALFAELVKDPKVQPIALRYYAHSLFKAKKLDESIKAFSEYFAKAPANEIVAGDYELLAEVQVTQGQDSLATISMREALKRDPTKVDLHRTLAETFFKKKKYDSAIVAYEQLFKKVDKPMSKDLYSIGRSYFQTKNFTMADSSFQKLTVLQPTSPLAFLWVARSKSNLDPESEEGLAKPFYEKYIELVPAEQVEKSKNDVIEAYSYLGYYHFIKSEFPPSKTAWQKVLSLDPGNKNAQVAIDAINGGGKKPAQK